MAASNWNGPYLILDRHGRLATVPVSPVRFLLRKPMTIMGRGPHSNITLPDRWAFVSRHHCIFRLMRDRKCFVKRLSQHNIWVNSELLLQGHARELKDKDKIEFLGQEHGDWIRLVFHSNAKRPVELVNKRYDASKQRLCQNWVNTLVSDSESSESSSSESSVEVVVKRRKLNRDDHQLCKKCNSVHKSPKGILRIDKGMRPLERQVEEIGKSQPKKGSMKELTVKEKVEQFRKEYLKRRKRLDDEWTEEFLKGNFRCGTCNKALDQAHVGQYGYDFCKNCQDRRSGGGRGHARSSGENKA